MKKVFMFVLMLTLMVSLVACSGEELFDYETNTLVVGLEVDYPPFNWDENEKNDYNFKLSGNESSYVAGYDVDIAILLARELNMELEFKMIPWGSLVPALRSNKIDVIIAGMSPTDQRKQQITFTNPYYNVNHVIVARKDGILNTMNSLNELKGLDGIGQLSTIYDDLIGHVKDRYEANHLPGLDSNSAITTAIATGGADFTIVEKPVALGMVAQNDKLKIVFEEDSNIFELSESDRELSIGLRKIDTELAKLINDALDKITQEQRTSLMDLAVIRAKNSNE